MVVPGGATSTLYVHASVLVFKVAVALGAVSATAGTTFAALATARCSSVMESLAVDALHPVQPTIATANAVDNTDVRTHHYADLELWRR